MKSVTVFLAAASAAALTVPASAQDDWSEDQPLAGLYIGGEIGYDSFDFDGTGILAEDDLFNFDSGFDGASFNALAGIGWVLHERFYVGVEGSLGFTTASDDLGEDLDFDDDDDLDDIDEFEDIGDLGGDFTYAFDGHVGYLLTPRLLAFGVIGFGGIDLADDFDDNFEEGLRYGGGVQYAFNNTFSVRFRYVRSPLIDNDATGFGDTEFGADLTRNQFNGAVIVTF